MSSTSGKKLPVIADPATGGVQKKKTEVGSVFVSNYPPYSFWDESHLPAAESALDSPPRPNTPLGLYMHIPFCRKRCKFCYFRVYTDKNASDIQLYLDALVQEIARYSEKQAVKGRELEFIYFGGGTPSYIAAKHLRALVDRVREHLPWDSAKEIAFECEPGTLTRSKLEAIREIGVTRLSLGVENFDDGILRENGRAHVSTEIYRVLPWIQELDFDQLNIDLISGMVGETWETWKDSVQKTIDLGPDSVTIYQMELPFNTVYSKAALDGESDIKIADWQMKRAWQDYAFNTLAEAGYEISSAYTMVRSDKKSKFIYRDAVWHGCDMLGTGVASFGHMSGVHIQNTASWDDYLGRIDAGGLPVKRAFSVASDEQLVREMILQLKLGHLDGAYFESKFGTNIFEHFAEAYNELERDGWLQCENGGVQLTRDGLLRVDQLLPIFYQEKYRHARYT